MSNPIKNVTCVGSGLIGQGWATLFAAGGCEVTLQDASDERLQKAVEQVELNLRFLEDNGRLQAGATAEAYRRIRTNPDLAGAVAVADYVQESVPDNYPAKKKVFAEMDAHAPAEAILASSSSGLLMSEIQQVVSRPQRCVLAHPFLPVHLLPLVEVVGGEQTAPETVRVTCDLMEKIGKTPVRLKKEVSGYIVNRLQAALMRACLAGDGIDNFVKEYSDSYRIRWESMAAWNTLSPTMKEILVESVNAMPIVRENSLQKIKDWRDQMLIEILKLQRKCC
jgi:carnitine 3-dehydrogenase